MKQRLPAKRTTGWTSNLLAAAGDVLVPLLFAFGVGSIFSLICGCNPFTLYSYIIKKAFFLRRRPAEHARLYYADHHHGHGYGTFHPCEYVQYGH